MCELSNALSAESVDDQMTIVRRVDLERAKPAPLGLVRSR